MKGGHGRQRDRRVAPNAEAEAAAAAAAALGCRRLHRLRRRQAARRRQNLLGGLRSSPRVRIVPWREHEAGGLGHRQLEAHLAGELRPRLRGELRLVELPRALSPLGRRVGTKQREGEDPGLLARLPKAREDERLARALEQPLRVLAPRGRGGHTAGQRGHQQPVL